MSRERLGSGIRSGTCWVWIPFALIGLMPVVSCCSSTGSEQPEQMLSTIRTDLANHQIRSAVRQMAVLIKRFPDSAATIRAFTRIAMRFDERTVDVLKKETGPTSVSPQLEILETYRATWLKLAPKEYDDAVGGMKLIDAKGLIDRRALEAAGVEASKHLDLYLEQGFAFYEFAKTENRSHLDSAYAVCGNILRVSEDDTERWWQGKYLMLLVLDLRSKETPQEIRVARVALEHVELSHPNFDSDRFEMRERFLALKDRLRQQDGQK